MECREIAQDFDVVKKGYLHIKRPPSNSKIRIKAWQKKYILLRDDSYENPRQLEIYNTSETHPRISGSDKHIVDLTNAVKVEDYPESKSFPYAIELVMCGSDPIFLAGDTEEEANDWKLAIRLLINKTGTFRSLMGSSEQRVTEQQTCGITVSRRRCSEERRPCHSPVTSSQECKTNRVNNNIYHEFLKNGVLAQIQDSDDSTGFPVLIQSTPASSRNNLSGQYLLLVENGHVLLRSLSTRNNVMVWPIAQVLKYKREEVVRGTWDFITLETGIHCLNRGGVFHMLTNHGKEIIQMIRGATKHTVHVDNSVHQTAQNATIKFMTGNERAHSLSSLPQLPERASRCNLRKTSAPLGCISFDRHRKDSGVHDCQSSRKTAVNILRKDSGSHSEVRVRRNGVCHNENLQNHRKDSGFCESPEMNNNVHMTSRLPTTSRRRSSTPDGNNDIPPTPPPRPKHTLSRYSALVKNP